MQRPSRRPLRLPPIRLGSNARGRSRRPMQFSNNVRGNSSSVRVQILLVEKRVFKISCEVHNGFTINQKIIIENALQIVIDRLVEPEILLNMYQICGTSGCDLAEGVWERSKLENNDSYYGPHDLLRFQLMCLRVLRKRGVFPTIHIRPFYEESNTTGKGTAGCVSCVSDGSRFSIEGEFSVQLNLYHLGASVRDRSEPVYWAGVLVHEMLHNLGHLHDGEDYTSNWQINVFEECFKKNGNYST